MKLNEISQQQKMAAEQVLYERQRLFNQYDSMQGQQALSQLEGLYRTSSSCLCAGALGLPHHGVEAAGSKKLKDMVVDYIKPENKELSGILFSSQAVEIYKWTSYSVLSIIILLAIIFSGQQVYEYISVCID